MATPLHTIERTVQVGIYDNCTMMARVYDDKVIVIEPYVRWIGNTGGYAEAKKSIRNPQTVAQIIRELADDCEDTAWDIIERAISCY